MNSVQITFFGTGGNEPAVSSCPETFVPGDLENRILRQAVQENPVSFPFPEMPPRVSSSPRTNGEERPPAVISAANELFQRFQQHAFKHSSLSARTA